MTGLFKTSLGTPSPLNIFLYENFNLGISHRLEDFPEIWS